MYNLWVALRVNQIRTATVLFADGKVYKAGCRARLMLEIFRKI